MRALLSPKIVFAILLFVFLPCAEAQQGGQGGGSAGGAAGGTEGTASKGAPSSPIIAPPAEPRLPSEQIPQVIYISGSVIQEDGTPPPFGAVIELDCGSSVTREATVSLNGRFGFQLGDTNRFSSLLPDASQGTSDPFGGEPMNNTPFEPGSGPHMRMMLSPMPLSSKLAGCGLRAQLDGYRSSVIRFRGGPLSGLNEVGTIVIYPVERVRGSAVSATSLLAPKAAKKSMEQARKAFRKKKYDESEAHLKHAVALYPQYGEAWFQLGQLYQSRRRDKEARDAYEKAIGTDSLYVSPYIGLGWLACGERRWQEVVDLSEHALALDPVTFPDAYYLNSLANYNLGNMELAEKRARQTQRLDSTHRFPKAHLILANIFSSRNETTASIEEMRDYLKYAPKAPDADLVRSRLQEMEKLAKAVAK